METLSEILQPYKQIVGTVAMYVTVAQFLSGASICKDIYKNKSTKGKSATPFIGAIAIGILMLKYGYLISDSVTINVNIGGIFFNLIWATIYYWYTENKWEDFLKPSSYAVALVAAFLGYAAIENPSNLEYRYSLMITILMLMLLGAPLMDVKDIVAKKDASSIPFPITFMATLVTFLWLLYGVILNNNFMVVQNVIGFVLCLTQLILIAVFRKPKTGHQHSD